MALLLPRRFAATAVRNIPNNQIASASPHAALQQQSPFFFPFRTLFYKRTVAAPPQKYQLPASLAQTSTPSSRSYFSSFFSKSKYNRPSTIHFKQSARRTISIFQSFSLLSLFSSSPSRSKSDKNMTSYEVNKSDDEWRAVLSPEQFRILREKGTEQPGSGEYEHHKSSGGDYNCAGCGTPLYKSSHKFDSGCGWPAFFDAYPGAIERHEDKTLGRLRIEIVCAKCGGHLGHVFKGEGYKNPIDERHCVNSVSIKFDDGKEKAKV